MILREKIFNLLPADLLISPGNRIVEVYKMPARDSYSFFRPFCITFSACQIFLGIILRTMGVAPLAFVSVIYFFIYQPYVCTTSVLSFLNSTVCVSSPIPFRDPRYLGWSTSPPSLCPNCINKITFIQILQNLIPETFSSKATNASATASFIVHIHAGSIEVFIHWNSPAH